MPLSPIIIRINLPPISGRSIDAGSLAYTSPQPISVWPVDSIIWNGINCKQSPSYAHIRRASASYHPRRSTSSLHCALALLLYIKFSIGGEKFWAINHSPNCNNESLILLSSSLSATVHGLSHHHIVCKLNAGDSLSRPRSTLTGHCAINRIFQSKPNWYPRRLIPLMKLI